MDNNEAVIKKEWQGVFIPRKIWEEKDLTWTEKLFWAEIKGLDNDDGCYASNKHFAKVFSLSKTRVSEIINSLIIKKFITAEYIREDGIITKRVLRISEEKRERIFNSGRAVTIMRVSDKTKNKRMEEVRTRRKPVRV